MADRDESGRFLPGNPGGPGRPPKARNLAYVDAVIRALPPEQLGALLAEMVEFAETTQSWRGKLAAVRLALEYAVGKPTQRVEQQSSTQALEDVLATLRADDGDE
jgi:hypothetical protein